MKFVPGIWCLLALAAVLPAQTTGALEGMVLDGSGKAVPAAAVTIHERLTNSTRRIITNEGGYYLAPGLAPGLYHIEIRRPGFQPQRREEIVLTAARTVRADFQLAIGQVQETVTVNERPALVDPSASGWGGAIDSRKVDNLPLNGRDVFDLASQEPGAVLNYNVRKSLINGIGLQVSVNGARPNQNSYRVDNITMNDATSSAPASAGGRLLGLESIAELRLVTSPFHAEYGRAASGVITAVSRSGTNEWHGSAYEYLRSHVFDARNY
ncbi:MAG: carboxypeptidase regulatory-like domain-containing protein, partial [Bryobacteraceae bacterium]